MKYLILNIILFFLISLSVISRDNETPVISCFEVHTSSYDTSPGFLVPSINLIVSYAGNPPNQGIALLDWVFIDGSTNLYIISRSIEGSNWEIIDNNVPGTSNLYNDTIPDGYCEVTIQYKIEAIDNASGDIIISNTAGKIFTDSRQPEVPNLDSVSIVNNSQVILGWEASVSIDVIGTIIYRMEDVWKNIDTVFGNTNTSYLDNTYQTCNENYLYAIAALPSCGLPSPKTEITAQRPIFLLEPEYNLCLETISLSWDPYINASSPFNKYEIWLSKNGNEFTLIEIVGSNDTSYNHNNIENVTEYSYFVRAVFGDLNFTSTSCTKSIITGSYIKPDSIYLANASVLSDNNIELTIAVDLQPNSCTWEIIRSVAGGGSQTILTTLSRSNVGTSPITYLDETADGSGGYYTYSINVLDSCGTLSLQSNTIKTIFLEGEQLSDNENYLSWNFFEGFDGEVDKYYIFRMLGEVIPTLPIDSTDAQTNEYTDDISSVEAGEGKFFYRVQAKEGSENSYGYKEKSNSNIVSLFRETDLYFPNAFRPDGNNKVFKPVATGFGGSNYLFQIFNRWGQLIFESTDPELGWDGKYKGNSSPQGTYIYRLVYQNVYNITKQQQGTVTLID